MVNIILNDYPHIVTIMAKNLSGLLLFLDYLHCLT